MTPAWAASYFDFISVKEVLSEAAAKTFKVTGGLVGVETVPQAEKSRQIAEKRSNVHRGCFKKDLLMDEIQCVPVCSMLGLKHSNYITNPAEFFDGCLRSV